MASDNSASKGVAIVTGAAQTLGKAIALKLASDGYDIALNDLPSQKTLLEEVASTIQAKNRRICVVYADVTVENEVRDMVQTVVDQLGSVNVMIANAGICVTKSIQELTLEQWNKVFAVNVGGTFLCYKYASAQMIRQGKGGRIIGASSVAGKIGAPFLSAYSASKWAVRGMTQTAALELGAHGITVNAYAPGPVKASSMWNTIGETIATVEAIDKDEEARTATGILSTPDDVAELVSWLVSPGAKNITGQSLSVDGGRFMS